MSRRCTASDLNCVHFGQSANEKGIREDMKENIDRGVEMMVNQSGGAAPGGGSTTRCDQRGGGDLSTNENAVQHRTFEAPRSSEEKTIAGIWEQLLEVENIGVHDNFLLLGGESLLATQVAARLREAFGVEVSVRSIFLGTIAEIAEEVVRAKKTGG